ncbi:unnamed protein product, partial [Ectocarpus fasciculatus]
TAAAYADEVKRDGYTVIEGFIPIDAINAMAAAFQPYLDTRLAKGNPDRGMGRYYITLPFEMPFANESLFAHPFLLSTIELIVGLDPVMCQLAADVPVKGSCYQPIHRDTKGLFFDPSGYSETPAYQLAVNFPLCDIASSDIGPLEISKGTHLLSSQKQDALIERNAVSVQELLMRKGDLIIRDVRGLHRGTPNITDTPRPMVVVGYSRSWLRRPEVGVKISKSVHDTLNEQSKRLLRFEPVVEDALLSGYDGEEIYDA